MNRLNTHSARLQASGIPGCMCSRGQASRPHPLARAERPMSSVASTSDRLDFHNKGRVSKQGVHLKWKFSSLTMVRKCTEFLSDYSVHGQRKPTGGAADGVRGHALGAQSATRWGHFPGSVLNYSVTVY